MFQKKIPCRKFKQTEIDRKYILSISIQSNQTDLQTAEDLDQIVGQDGVLRATGVDVQRLGVNQEASQRV